ncbi:hypothetical protein [Streptomyces sp. NPDC004324]
MNTRQVNTAAGVILAALTQNRTPAGIALALDSARLLLTPEIVAEIERLQARVVELEQQVERVKEAGTLLGSALVDQALETLTGAPGPVSLEDPHDSPLAHRYRVGRDLPPLGGASC